jgi:conjugal transfer/type IV secretion protein DotA/TraY
MMTTAFIGLTAGFILFYVLPFLPFLYFFFAVGAWVKSIFEAMVGVPLWALAHLRIDGEGLPGDSASNGYFLIFEIFLRPILTVFGLIASTIIFTAQVRVLNFIWALVIDNLTGFAGGQDTVVASFYDVVIHRDIVDQFFFTIVYTIIVYMMATASFKLIDTLPDNILRWMGAGVSSFGDINDDPTEGLTRYAAIGGMTFGQKASEGVVQLGKGIGNIAAQEGKSFQGVLGGMAKSGPLK